MNGKKKKWVALKEPMGACSCCIHEAECEPIRKHTEGEYLNGRYKFRCPILIEIDEEVME